MKYFYNDTDYIYYEKEGLGDHLVLFFHGFGSCINTWDIMRSSFDRNHYTCYYFDLKGFGKSSVPRDNKYDFLAHSTIIFEFIKSKKLKNFILIGHSMGGGVVLYLNIFFKVKPLKNVLIDSAGYLSNLPFFIKFFRTPFLKFLPFLLNKRYISSYSLKKIAAIKNIDSDMIDRYAKSLQGNGKWYSFSRTANQIVPDEYPFMIKSLSKIKAKTLIIWGDQDPIFNLKLGERLSDSIPNSKLLIVKGSGHIPHEECFSLIEQEIINFISNGTKLHP